VTQLARQWGKSERGLGPPLVPMIVISLEVVVLFVDVVGGLVIVVVEIG